ncbi:hypothetical protein CCANI_07935 [Corynebacterium canis]|nr:hypothetical protein CCANI_07935 [Corynebacterium canis]
MRNLYWRLRPTLSGPRVPVGERRKSLTCDDRFRATADLGLVFYPLLGVLTRLCPYIRIEKLTGVPVTSEQAGDLIDMAGTSTGIWALTRPSMVAIASQTIHAASRPLDIIDLIR